MRVDRNTFRRMTMEGAVVLAGPLWLGHPRRCPNLFLEGPVYLGEGCRLEMGFLGMGTQVGNETVIRRCRSIGRFSVIGEHCRIGVALGMNTGELPVCAMVRSRQGWWEKTLQIERPLVSEKRSSVVIGSDVWIGDGAILLEGVTVGDGAVIAPQAFVSASVPEGALVCGNPAHISGYRYAKAFPWWKYGGVILEKTAFPDLAGQKEFFAKAAEESRHHPQIPFGKDGFFLCQKNGCCSLWRIAAGSRELLYQIPYQ